MNLNGEIFVHDFTEMQFTCSVVMVRSFQKFRMHSEIDHESLPNINNSPPSSKDSIFTDSVAAEFNQAVSRTHAYMFFDSPSSIPEELRLKTPNLSNIFEVSIDLRSALVLHAREVVAAEIDRCVLGTSSHSVSSKAESSKEMTEWLVQLFSCFDAAVEIGRADVILTVFQLLKTIFIVGTPQSLVRLVDDDVYETVFSILKNDSDIPAESRVDHLSLLKSKAHFNQMHADLPTSISHSIRRSFRLGYIKDSVLARHLDDMTFVSFVQAINSLNSHTISHFIDHPQGLLGSLSLSSVSAQEFPRVLQFVQSILSASRTLTVEEKVSIVVELCDDTFFTLLEHNLALPSRDSVVEILVTICTLNSSFIRERCIADQSPNLLTRLISALHEASNTEHQTSQIADLFRLLLEPIPFSETFVTHFYEKDYLVQLGTFPSSLPPFSVQTILDLLAYCVVSHSNTFKAYFLRFGSLGKLLRSILIDQFYSRIVQLSAIRLVRAIFWQKDQMYFRYLQAFNIPCLILQLLFLHRPDTQLMDGNMIYSSSLEIITFVCVNNQTSVMETLCRQDTESERIVNILAGETRVRAHSELAQFMLTAVDRLRNPITTNVEDMNSRQSLTSSRGRSVSPRPLLVPVPRPRRRSTTIDEEDDDENSGLTNFKRFRFSSDSP